MNPLNRNPQPGIHKPQPTPSIPLEKQSTLQLVGTICENFNAAMTLQESAQRHGENAQQAQQRLGEIKQAKQKLSEREQEVENRIAELQRAIAAKKTQPPTIATKS